MKENAVQIVSYLHGSTAFVSFAAGLTIAGEVVKDLTCG